jgi:hypothetical protein
VTGEPGRVRCDDLRPPDTETTYRKNFFSRHVQRGLDMALQSTAWSDILLMR